MTPSPGTPVKVLFIGGTGRTGSTLLEKLLAQFDGVFAAGETMWLWYALAGNGRCSCGQPLRSCGVWTAIFDEAFGGVERIDAGWLYENQWRFHSGHLPLTAVPPLRERLLERVTEHRTALEQVLVAIRDVTGARLVIDKSLSPHHSYVLRQSPALDLYFLHLERDPRAIAYSWSKPTRERGFDGNHTMEQRGAVTSAVMHDFSNIAAETLWGRREDRYLRLRYEDLVADPASALREVGRFVDEDLDPTAILSGGEVTVRPTHSAWGNPNRFDSGRIEIRADDAWRDRLTTPDRLVTTALTWPLLRRYGYPVGATG
jgi:hypothetical protein